MIATTIRSYGTGWHAKYARNANGSRRPESFLQLQARGARVIEPTSSAQQYVTVHPPLDNDLLVCHNCSLVDEKVESEPMPPYLVPLHLWNNLRQIDPNNRTLSLCPVLNSLYWSCKAGAICSSYNEYLMLNPQSVTLSRANTSSTATVNSWNTQSSPQCLSGGRRTRSWSRRMGMCIVSNIPQVPSAARPVTITDYWPVVRPCTKHIVKRQYL